MADITLVADVRTEFGKGASRRLRASNQTPAVLYGHGTEPLHIILPAHQTLMALKHSNLLFSLVVDGEEKTALVKDVQRNPLKDTITHVDFILVRKGEKVQVEVEVIIVGEPSPGTIHLIDLQTLHVEAEATNLPTTIEVDITGIPAGKSVTAAEVILPEGTTLVTEGAHHVVTITEPRGAETEEEEAASEA